MCYNSTGVRFALQKFEFVRVSLWGFSLFLANIGCFFCCSVCVGRTSHPSKGFFCFFFLFSFSCIFPSINIFLFVSDKKKIIVKIG